LEDSIAIDRLFMSGTRATFTLEEDARIDQPALKEALKGKSLELVSLERRESKRAQAAYVIKTPGLT